MRAVLRLVKISVQEDGRRALEPPKSLLLVPKVGNFEVKVYSSRLEYLLVQPEGYSDVFAYRGPLRLAPEPWTSYCQWHDGPLDEADDPTKRLYCVVQAEGFCSKHRRSERAVYTICLDSRSQEALEACKKIDQSVKSEYVVYMLDFGGDKPKVGTTRKFRLLERIAEQPHLLATVLLETDSLYQARRAEISLSRQGLAVESWRHRWVLGLDLYFSALRLSEHAEKAAKALGVSWSGEMFTVGSDVPQKPVIVEPGLLEGKEINVLGAWGGFLLLEGPRGPMALKYSSLLHKDSLLVDKGELGLH
ncbi:MAG: hypothetical protein ACP5FT_00725 [Acidilobus sp.]